MKTITLLFVFGFLHLSTIAQSSQIIYSYDGAGNRVQRALTVFRLGEEDTTQTEAMEDPPIEDGNITAYPNPTNGSVNISVSSTLLEEGDGRYIVVDLSGKEVSKGQILQSQTVLDLTGEAGGNYILTVFVGERREEWQIVKQ